METIGARKANPLLLYGCDAEFSGLLCCVHAGGIDKWKNAIRDGDVTELIVSSRFATLNFQNSLTRATLARCAGQDHS